MPPAEQLNNFDGMGRTKTELAFLICCRPLQHVKRIFKGTLSIEIVHCNEQLFPWIPILHSSKFRPIMSAVTRDAEPIISACFYHGAPCFYSITSVGVPTFAPATISPAAKGRVRKKHGHRNGGLGGESPSFNKMGGGGGEYPSAPSIQGWKTLISHFHLVPLHDGISGCDWCEV